MEIAAPGKSEVDHRHTRRVNTIVSGLGVFREDMLVFRDVKRRAPGTDNTLHTTPG